MESWESFCSIWASSGDKSRNSGISSIAQWQTIHEIHQCSASDPRTQRRPYGNIRSLVHIALLACMRPRPVAQYTALSHNDSIFLVFNPRICRFQCFSSWPFKMTKTSDSYVEFDVCGDTNPTLDFKVYQLPRLAISKQITPPYLFSFEKKVPYHTAQFSTSKIKMHVKFNLEYGFISNRQPNKIELSLLK